MLFLGDKGRGQRVAVEINLKLDDGDDVTAVDVAHAAIGQRFGHETEFNADNCSLYVSKAATIAPTKSVELDAKIVASERTLPDGALTTLWLHVEMSNATLATLRAKAANLSYLALQTEASLENICFSDTSFAGLLGKKCPVLCKALGRSRCEATPANGSFLIKVETRVADYRGDLSLLKRDLENLAAAKETFAQATKGAVDTDQVSAKQPQTQ